MSRDAGGNTLRTSDEPATSAHRASATAAFLSCFSSKHREEVIEFGKRLSSIEADYYLFLARKAVCFFECLSALKLTSLRGPAVSDRVLDMDLAWLKGKRVAIIDDAVIYGSTLSNIRKKLIEEAGAHVVGTYVFCVNKTSWREDLIAPTPPFLRLDEKEATGFCADLVRALSVVPVPYATDYPLIRRLRVVDTDLPHLLTLPGWQTKTHSSPLQESLSISTLVASPGPATLADIFPEAESSLEGICSLVKVRLYGRRIDKHQATWFTVMPVAVLDPLTVEDIDDIWKSVLVGVEDGEQKLIEQHFDSSKARLRAIQFIVAARVGRVWVGAFRQMLGLRVAPRLDATFAGYSFPPAVSNLITRLAARGVVFTMAAGKSAATASLVKVERTLETYEPNPWSLQAALIKPFLDLYFSNEKPARQERLPLEDQHEHILHRLSKGFSLPQLRQAVKGISGDLPPLSILSEFLDYAIDRGFVVPITAEDGNVVFRAYRYGEDILDSEQFQHLCTLCAKSFLEGANAGAIPRTWLEKLLVILLEGLLGQNQVNPSDLAMGSSGTLGVRYALHGAVLKEASASIYSHYEGRFYVDVLEKYGHFRRIDVVDMHSANAEKQVELPIAVPGERRDRVRRYVPIQSKEPIPESPLAVAIAEEVGLVFGALYARTPPTPGLTLSDVILIATCNSPASALSAVAAELDILRAEWRFVRSAINSGRLPDHQGARKELWFTAINSARFKLRGYILDEADRKLDGIERSLRDDNELSSRFLASKLRSFRQGRLQRANYSREDQLYRFLLELGRAVYEVNILVRLLLGGLEAAMAGAAVKSASTEVLELASEFEFLLNNSGVRPGEEHRLTESLSNALARIRAGEIDAVTLWRWAYRRIEKEVSAIAEHLRRVDHLAARMGLANPFDLFPHVVVMEAREKGVSRALESAVNSLTMRATQEYNKRASAAQGYQVVFRPETGLARLIAVAFRGDGSKGLWAHFVECFRQSPVLQQVGRVWAISDLWRDDQPMKSSASPRCVASSLWQLVAAAVGNEEMSVDGLYMLRADEDRLRLEEKDGADSLPDEKLVTLSALAGRTFAVEFVQLQGGKQTRKAGASSVVAGRRGTQRQRSSSLADVGIVCVTATELRAVLDAMQELPNAFEEERFRYYSATMVGHECDHRVA